MIDNKQQDELLVIKRSDLDKLLHSEYGYISNTWDRDNTVKNYKTLYTFPASEVFEAGREAIDCGIMSENLYPTYKDYEKEKI